MALHVLGAGLLRARLRVWGRILGLVDVEVIIPSRVPVESSVVSPP